MHKAFETLASLLEEEVARQEEVLAATRAQGRAARARDVKAIEEQSAILMVLAQKTAHAEMARKRALRQLLGRDPGSETTLRDVIIAAPEECRSHLNELRDRLRALLSVIREETRENMTWIRASLKVVRRALLSVEPYLQACSGHYSTHGELLAGHGHTNTLSAMQPALIDRKG